MCVCHGFYYDEVGIRHPPPGIMSFCFFHRLHSVCLCMGVWVCVCVYTSPGGVVEPTAAGERVTGGVGGDVPVCGGGRGGAPPGLTPPRDLGVVPTAPPPPCTPIPDLHLSTVETRCWKPATWCELFILSLSLKRFYYLTKRSISDSA
jgi:hypothetical protein